jgi:hypothetical protein
MTDLVTDLTDEDIRTELTTLEPRAEADDDGTDGDGADADDDGTDADDDASDGDADGTDG